jgi:hypothetical protein
MLLVKKVDPALDLKYNKHYIGIVRDGTAFNFISFRPKKSTITFEVHLPQTDDIDAKIDQAGLETLEYNTRWGFYRLRLIPADTESKSETLHELTTLAYERRSASV